MLGQWLDRRQRLQFLSARPVIGELLGMEACPRSDEPQCTRRERPIEHSQRCELDLSDLVAVLCVEVWRRMIGAVHPYDDSVERGQARHRAIVGDSAADMANSISGGDGAGPALLTTTDIPIGRRFVRYGLSASPGRRHAYSTTWPSDDPGLVRSGHEFGESIGFRCGIAPPTDTLEGEDSVLHLRGSRQKLVAIGVWPKRLAEAKWTRRVSNLRPLACEASALPLSYAS
jgi:hypothetical protein